MMSDIPDGVIQTCVTSPPYYGLRDYGIEGQLGMEATVANYVERLVGVFREVRRVLRDDGTAWLNLGDSYATDGLNGPQGVSGDRASRSFTAAALKPKRRDGVKAKDLIGAPWAVAFALRSDGWWLRDAIVWHKPNPMPSSVEDRCTPSYEMIFLLAKSSRYFYDQDAIRDPVGLSMREKSEHGAYVKASEYRHDEARTVSQQSANRVLHDASAMAKITEQGANKRNVWTIATTPYSDAHFATFPIEIPSLCIRAGSKPGDLVLDPFLGSGATAEAAESLGRRWVGYELNPAYCDLIAARTRQKGLFSA